MPKITGNILNKSLNKFRSNFTIECIEQPLTLLISACHSEMSTGISIIPHPKQISYMNPVMIYIQI